MAENYDAQHESVLRREERKLERAKAKAEAAKENMISTISAHLKQDATRKAIQRDTIEATKDPSRRDAIFNQAGGGLFKSDRDLVTGEEPRPWEDN